MGANISGSLVVLLQAFRCVLHDDSGAGIHTSVYFYGLKLPEDSVSAGE